MQFPEPLPDYYAVLGVDREASERDIVVAYRREVRQSHPDAHPGSAIGGERIREVNRAYEVLGDPAHRAEYDRELARREESAFLLGVPLVVGYSSARREWFSRSGPSRPTQRPVTAFADLLAVFDALLGAEELAVEQTIQAMAFERAFLVELTDRRWRGWYFWPW
jgi:curved DNA-binding protein CbpA